MRIKILLLMACLIILAGADAVQGQGVPTLSVQDQPTITGHLGGSVSVSDGTGSGSFLVQVNFGELSPINKNQLVKVVIPIRLLSIGSYQITASLTSPVIADPNALRSSDIGVGIQNLNKIIGVARCPGRIQAPFENDPALTFSVNSATGRASYQTSLVNIGASTALLRGPGLMQAKFDLILVVPPGFYAPGSTTFTIMLVIVSGPSFNC
jgi:hypothetical protein